MIMDITLSETHNSWTTKLLKSKVYWTMLSQWRPSTIYKPDRLEQFALSQLCRRNPAAPRSIHRPEDASHDLNGYVIGMKRNEQTEWAKIIHFKFKLDNGHNKQWLKINKVSTDHLNKLLVELLALPIELQSGMRVDEIQHERVEVRLDEERATTVREHVHESERDQRIKISNQLSQARRLHIRKFFLYEHYSGISNITFIFSRGSSNTKGQSYKNRNSPVSLALGRTARPWDQRSKINLLTSLPHHERPSSDSTTTPRSPSARRASDHGPPWNR